MIDVEWTGADVYLQCEGCQEISSNAKRGFVSISLLPAPPARE